MVLEQSFGPQAGDQIAPLGQPCRVDAGIHAQTEGDFLRFPRGRGQDFFVADRTHPRLDGADVGRGVGHVLPTALADRRPGARAETEVVRAFPVGQVVVALASGLRVVGDFVLPVAGRPEERDAAFEKSGIAVPVLGKFAPRLALEEFGVLLVGQAIRRDVLGPECGGLPDALLPLREGLARNPVDQVEVKVVESGAAQDGEGSPDLLGIMDASEQFEQVRVPRLHAHADAIDPGAAEQVRLALRHGGRVHLDGEFLDPGEIHLLAQTGEEPLQLRHGQRGRGAAADEDGARRDPAAEPFCLAHHGLDQRIGLPRTRDVLVKTAVRADLQAERDVDVEMACFLRGRRRVFRFR